MHILSSQPERRGLCDRGLTYMWDPQVWVQTLRGWLTFTVVQSYLYEYLKPGFTSWDDKTFMWG